MTKIEAGRVVADDFETWLNARPKWLQTAARMIIDSKRQLNPDEVRTLARLCKREANDEADPAFHDTHCSHYGGTRFRFHLDAPRGFGCPARRSWFVDKVLQLLT